MIRVLSICVTALIFSINLPDTVCAQAAQSSSTIARIVYIEDAPSRDAQGLAGSLEALQRETERLKRTLAVESPNAAATTTPTANFLPAPVTRLPQSGQRPRSGTLAQTTDLATTKDIHDRIELLKRIYRQKAETDAAKPKNPSVDLKPATTPTPPTDNTPATDNRPATSAITEPAPPAEKRETKEPASAFKRPSAPADLFELANSLYQTGDLQTAYEIYSQVDRSTVTAAEAVWLDFMIASCHRRMGNWDDATSLYREIANQNTADNLAKPAQVWLKQVELLSNAEQSFSDLETQIESLLEKAKSHVPE